MDFGAQDIIELSSGVGQVGAFKGTKAIRALRLLKLMRHLTVGTYWEGLGLGSLEDIGC